MFILVKQYEGQIDEDWGYRGPFATPEETYEEGRKLISAMCDEEANATKIEYHLDLDGLFYVPETEKDDPEHVTELTILESPNTPMFGIGYSASSNRFFLTRLGKPLEGVMFDTLVEAYQHGLENELWKANSPPRVSWFT